MNNKICFVTDSSSTFSPQTAQQAGIQLIPLTINDHQGNVLPSFNNLTIISSYLKQGKKISTSSTPLGVLINYFTCWLQSYDQVVYLTISAQLSSQYLQAQIAAKEVDPSRIHVIDSCTTAYNLEYLTLKIQSKFTNQPLDVKKIHNFIHTFQKSNLTYFICDQIKYIVQSGRADPKLKFLSKLVRPIIAFDQKTKIMAVSTTNKAALKKLLQIFHKKITNNPNLLIKQLVVYNFNYPEEKFNHFLTQTKNQLPIEPNQIIIRDCPPPIFCHVGPGSFGLGIILGMKNQL